MKRLFPYPLLTVLLFLFWLFLNQSVSLGQILLGSLLSTGAALALSALRLPGARVRNVKAIVLLSFMVLRDSIRSNFAVARLILRPESPGYTSGFMTINLDMRNQYGLAMLAMIITATPGTLWVNYDSSNGALMIHVLDLVDEETWIKTIKHGYERLLMEIFE